MGFTSITNLGGGRSLISSPNGDQHFVEDESGSRSPVSAQEASVLLQQAKDVKPDAPAPKRRRRKKEEIPRKIPMSQAEIDAAAAYLVKHDPKDASRFAALDLEFNAAVKVKAKEIKQDILDSYKGRDPRDRTPEVGIMVYRSAARKFLEDLAKQER